VNDFDLRTLRRYDADRAQWSLPRAHDRSGVLFPPLAGSFPDGRGGSHGTEVARA
jgi:hypothetical protein